LSKFLTTMEETKSKFFSVMVVGDEPEKIMEKYSSSKKVEPYVKYEYLKASKYQERAIKALAKILEESDKIGFAPNVQESLSNRLDVLKKMSSFEYYKDLTEGMYYDENGNALSDENPNAKWNTSMLGRNFSLPLLLNDGTETYTAMAKDVAWEAMQGKGANIYQAAWEVVVDKREPKNDEERQIYEAMKDNEGYFSNFKDKESYVIYSSSYWNYAYVDKDGWHDMDSETNGDETEWISTFFEKYVKNLKPTDKVSIFECSTASNTK